MKSELYKNYLKSLEQKYNAVCFDIDGTLTVENSKSIDKRAIKMIINLLKNKIPVVFITGRGETGINDLKCDIHFDILCNKGLAFDDLKRIYVLANDGLRLFYSNDVGFDSFLSESVYVSTTEELKQLDDINNYALKLKEESIYGDKFYITYSNDSKTKQILNVRINFGTNDEGIITSIYDKIKKYINSNNFKDVFLNRGIYSGRIVFQIGIVTKDKAIERTEKLIGVPKDSMIRIGDCGDALGNDYAMLNCNQGYSVNKTSGSIDSCFPVFDEDGNIIKGVVATLQLIKKSKILPTVCLEKATKSDYQHNFAKVEKNIVLGRQKLLKKYNDIINSNFFDCNVIEDLFDKCSGSIKIPMYEMELLDNRPLKELWLTTINGNQAYSIRDDNNYLLRGSSTYYYFISNRLSNNGKDITTKKDVMNWYMNYLQFLNDSIDAILITNNLNDQINKKLLLGIIDNCRNILILLLNHSLVSNYYNKNVLLDISSNKEKKVAKLYKNLIKLEKLMSDICFKNKFTIDRNYILDGISNTREILLANMDEELNKEEKEDYSKDYRTYREIDNFAENYVTVSLYSEKREDNGKFINACGICYGGIELPILSKIINQSKIEKLLLLKFNKEVSGYTNKQLIDLRNFNINNFGGLLNSNIYKNTNVDLFDDNVLTGKTLQLAINSLYDFNIKVKNICIVRYPSINRIDQMFLDNTAAVDYNLFFQYIHGLCFSSPYSWKDDNWRKENGKLDYTDSLGVFDLNRKKIIECILKNHDYKENSEVGEYKKRILK